MNELLSTIDELGARFSRLPCRVLAFRDSIPAGLCGCYVSLHVAGGEHVLALLAHPLGWEELGKALDLETPSSEPRGLVDGACELVTMLAESFRRKLEPTREAPVGLPLFVEGTVRAAKAAVLRAADVSIGESWVLLVLFSSASAFASSGKELS